MTQDAVDPPGRPRRQSPEVRRDQILDAAARVLIAQGLGASMADVATAAGVAKGTVYLYFESKAELLAGLRARYLAQFVERVLAEQRAAASASHLAAIEQFAASLFDWSVTNAALHHVLFQEAGVSEDDAFAHGRAALAAEIRAGVESGEFDVNDPDLATGFLLQGIHAMLVDTIEPGTPDRERFLRGVTDLVPRVLTRATG